MRTILSIETTFPIGKAKLIFRLHETCHGPVLEREFVEANAAQTQILAINTLETLRKFMEADPYYLQLNLKFDRIYQAAATSLSLVG